MKEFELFVPGIARTAGSHKTFDGRITHASRHTKTWMDKISWFALKEYGERQILHTGAVIIEITAYLERPKGHYGTGRNAGKLKPSAPKYHLKKPDDDKISRAVRDALTKIIYKDDAQIIKTVTEKHFADDSSPGVFIKVTMF